MPSKCHNLSRNRDGKYNIRRTNDLSVNNHIAIGAGTVGDSEKNDHDSDD